MINNHDMHYYGNAKTAACKIKQIFEKSRADIRFPMINISLMSQSCMESKGKHAIVFCIESNCILTKIWAFTIQSIHAMNLYKIFGYFNLGITRPCMEQKNGQAGNQKIL